MNKQEAIAAVAAHAAGLLQAGDFEESTRFREDDVSEADAARLGAAVETVVDRLYRMGKR